MPGEDADQIVVPASVGQRLLWLLQHYRASDGALNVPLLYRVRGPLDITALGAAMSDVTARHESLRTTFAGRGANLQQVLNAPRRQSFEVVDLGDEPDPEAAVADAIRRELRTPIDVQNWPVRLRAVRLADEHHIVSVNVHHLATDGWSSDIVARELADLYSHHAAGAVSSLDAVVWQHRDFSRWQDEFLASDAATAHRDYWVDQLQGGTVPTLPRREVDRRPTSFPSAIERVVLPADVAGRIVDLGKAARTTPFAAMLAAFKVLLAGVTGVHDLTVGSLFANRTRTETLGTVGFLTTMVLLRTRLDPSGSFADAVAMTRRTALDAFLHQGMPYHLLPARAQAGPTRGDELVFQMIANVPQLPDFAGLQVEPYDVYEGLAGRFDFEVVLVPRAGGEMEAYFYYAADRYDGDWVRGLARRFGTVMATVGHDPTSPLSALDLSLA